MILAETIEELQKAKHNLKGTIGFIPTMGALHKGHLSLIQQARNENDIVIVSIFVNPTQFLEGEDLDSYPKREEADKKICEIAKVDILFMPNIGEMYEDDELNISAPAIRGYILEGKRRPKHFDGMLQIVMKLLNLSSSTNAYFGKKDAQQLVLITQMVKNYFIPCNIIACDIVRDDLGLALSSRNAYLSEDDKKEALKLSSSLYYATKMIISGKKESDIIIQEIKNILKCDNIKIEYISIVSRDFKPLEVVEIGNTIILIAVFIGNTRLIDNIWI